jgi:hypothetical protein
MVETYEVEKKTIKDLLKEIQSIEKVLKGLPNPTYGCIMCDCSCGFCYHRDIFSDRYGKIKREIKERETKKRIITQNTPKII